MTPAARIEATLDLLQAIEDTPRPADALVSAYFRARRFIGSKDRAAVSTRLYAVLRHQARLDWWINHAGASLSDTPLPHPSPRGGGESSCTPRARLLVWLALAKGSRQRRSMSCAAAANMQRRL